MHPDRHRQHGPEQGRQGKLRYSSEADQSLFKEDKGHLSILLVGLKQSLHTKPKLDFCLSLQIWGITDVPHHTQ